MLIRVYENKDNIANNIAIFISDNPFEGPELYQFNQDKNQYIETDLNFFHPDVQERNKKILIEIAKETKDEYNEELKNNPNLSTIAFWSNKLKEKNFAKITKEKERKEQKRIEREEQERIEREEQERIEREEQERIEREEQKRIKKENQEKIEQKKQKTIEKLKAISKIINLEDNILKSRIEQYTSHDEVSNFILKIFNRLSTNHFKDIFSFMIIEKQLELFDLLKKQNNISDFIDLVNSKQEDLFFKKIFNVTIYESKKIIFTLFNLSYNNDLLQEKIKINIDEINEDFLEKINDLEISNKDMILSLDIVKFDTKFQYFDFNNDIKYKIQSINFEEKNKKEQLAIEKARVESLRDEEKRIQKEKEQEKARKIAEEKRLKEEAEKKRLKEEAKAKAEAEAEAKAIKIAKEKEQIAKKENDIKEKTKKIKEAIEQNKYHQGDKSWLINNIYEVVNNISIKNEIPDIVTKIFNNLNLIEKSTFYNEIYINQIQTLEWLSNKAVNIFNDAKEREYDPFKFISATLNTCDNFKSNFLNTNIYLNQKQQPLKFVLFFYSREQNALIPKPVEIKFSDCVEKYSEDIEELLKIYESNMTYGQLIDLNLDGHDQEAGNHHQIEEVGNHHQMEDEDIVLQMQIDELYNNQFI